MTLIAATRTIYLPNQDSMVFDAVHIADYKQGYADFDSSAIAANCMPFATYMNPSRRQAYLTGWTAAKEGLHLNA